MTTLSNSRQGDKILIRIHGPTVWADTEPTVEDLTGLVTRVDRPKPREVKEVHRVPCDKGAAFLLRVEKEPCPVVMFGSLTICPICGKEH